MYNIHLHNFCRYIQHLADYLQECKTLCIFSTGVYNTLHILVCLFLWGFTPILSYFWSCIFSTRMYNTLHILYKKVQHLAYSLQEGTKLCIFSTGCTTHCRFSECTTPCRFSTGMNNINWLISKVFQMQS